MGKGRAELEIRTVVVGWRSVMRQIRAGSIPSSRESAHRLMLRTLAALDNIERAHAHEAPADAALARMLRDAREEVQGAIRHDLADSGEQAG